MKYPCKGCELVASGHCNGKGCEWWGEWFGEEWGRIRRAAEEVIEKRDGKREEKTMSRYVCGRPEWADETGNPCPLDDPNEGMEECGPECEWAKEESEDEA